MNIGLGSTIRGLLSGQGSTDFQNSNSWKIEIQKALDEILDGAKYVTDPKTSKRIVAEVEQGFKFLGSGAPDAQWQARVHTFNATQLFTKARLDKLVPFYKKGEGFGYGLVFLVLFLITAAGVAFELGPHIVHALYALWLPSGDEYREVFSQTIGALAAASGSMGLLALAAGGIGGAASVFAKIVGINVKTEAMTAQNTWYRSTPILGAVMGLVTYIALSVVLPILNEQFTLDSQHAVFLVGFMAGYVEGISRGILDTVAGRLRLGGSTQE